MPIGIENFEEVRFRAEEFYKTINTVYCPYFKEQVSFNAQGLAHLKFKKREKARSERDQYMRFKLFTLAPEVIKLSHTLQGIWKTKQFEDIKVNSRIDSVLKPIIYYEFIAILRHVRVKIVIKQVELGQKMFWSIIPYWKRGPQNLRILKEGSQLDY